MCVCVHMDHTRAQVKESWTTGPVDVEISPKGVDEMEKLLGMAQNCLERHQECPKPHWTGLGAPWPGGRCPAHGWVGL